MEMLVVLMIVAAAGIWGALRLSRKLRAAPRGNPCGPGCGGCDLASATRRRPNDRRGSGSCPSAARGRDVDER